MVFLGKKLYAINHPIRFVKKNPIDLCLECSTWHIFFSSSFTVSITERLRRLILSHILIKLFFSYCYECL